MQTTEFLDKLKKLQAQDLIGIKGIGEVLAQNYVDFFNSSRFSKMYAKFQALEAKNQGLKIISTKVDKSNLPLFGKTVCITGSFEKPRNLLKTELENLGAKVVDAVSSKTNYLLAGEAGGSKITKAKDLGVQIVASIEEILG
jgi:DNA ligase (NAD+)